MGHAADGSGQEQVTVDDWNNWFPHISPDGAWMVFSFLRAGREGHPENKNVMLRIMSLGDGRDDKKISVLAKLFEAREDQRALLVAGQQTGCLCQLRARAGRARRQEMTVLWGSCDSGALPRTGGAPSPRAISWSYAC